MIKQTREFIEGISSKHKKMHIFTKPQDGSHDHCMLDNVSRMQYVVFEWLNEVFEYAYAHEYGHDEAQARLNGKLQAVGNV